MATAIQTQREYTRTALLTKDQRTALESYWKGGFHKQARLTHHLLYAMLRGKDWRKAATPPTNTVKVENGALTGWCFWDAYAILYTRVGWHHAEPAERLASPWEGTVTQDMLAEIRCRLPHPNAVRVAILDSKHTWACPAYHLDAAGE